MRVFNILLLCLVITSCRSLRPNIMFEVPKEYPMTTDTSSVKNKEYFIAVSDKIEMHLYSIEGFRLVDVTNSAIGGGTSDNINYIVEEDGQVKLPVLGKVPIVGLTMRQGERYLEEKY